MHSAGVLLDLQVVQLREDRISVEDAPFQCFDGNKGAEISYMIGCG